jgi:hypothetical protein
MKASEFLAAYIETALWSSTDGDGIPLDDSKYADTELAPKTLQQFEADCAQFQTEYAKLIMELDDSVLRRFPPESHIPHDFWLTQNRHGAGFWDGDYPDRIGIALTNLAHRFPERSLYVGDDGKIYL